LPKGSSTSNCSFLAVRKKTLFTNLQCRLPLFTEIIWLYIEAIYPRVCVQCGAICKRHSGQVSVTGHLYPFVLWANLVLTRNRRLDLYQFLPEVIPTGRKHGVCASFCSLSTHSSSRTSDSRVEHLSPQVVIINNVICTLRSKLRA
jgi:hypothetical protein